MFPKANRLKAGDVAQIKREGKLFHSGAFGVLVVHTNKWTGARIAIVVSTKVAKKATARNLLRRRLRKVLMPYLAKIRPGLGLVFLVKGSMAHSTESDLEKQVADLFSKIAP